MDSVTGHEGTPPNMIIRKKRNWHVYRFEPVNYFFGPDSASHNKFKILYSIVICLKYT
jgi:hypothetical protein